MVPAIAAATAPSFILSATNAFWTGRRVLRVSNPAFAAVSIFGYSQRFTQ
jgi:hypothetical protein